MSSQSQTDQSERDYSNLIFINLPDHATKQKGQKIQRWKDYCSHFVINLIFFFFFFFFAFQNPFISPFENCRQAKI